MSSTMFFRLLCIGLVATTSVSIPPALSQLTDAQSQAVNQRLDDVASLLRVPLQSNEVRQFILMETKAARNSEQILDLESVVSGAKTLGGADPFRSPGIWGALDAAIHDLKDAVRQDPNGKGVTIAQEPLPAHFDLYFPVEAHRRQWDGGTNLLIASAPVGDNDSIIAYRVQDGSMVILDPNTPPQTPTVVVGLNERQPGDASPPMVEMTANPPDEAQPLVPAPGDRNSYIGIPYIYLNDDHEPWIRGDAEVYVLVGQVYKGKAIKHRINLTSVDHDGRWYWLGDGPGYPLYFFFNNDYAAMTCFDFWEEDGGGASTHIGFSILGIGFGFSVSDDDDNMGKICINRDSIPWSGYTQFSTGDVVMKLDKDP